MAPAGKTDKDRGGRPAPWQSCVSTPNPTTEGPTMNEREIEIAKLNLRIEILETAFAMLAFSAGRDAPLL